MVGSTHGQTTQEAREEEDSPIEAAEGRQALLAYRPVHQEAMKRRKSFWKKSAKDFSAADWALLAALALGVVYVAPKMLAK